MNRWISRSVILIIGLLGVVLALGYFGLLDDTFLGPSWDSWVRGYGKAKTPQEAADLFKKAVKDRDYRMAAKYCTKDYAEQLKRGGKGAQEMGKKMDDLMFQMKEHGYSTDDSKLLFALLDPFPEVTIVVGAEANDKATATITFANGILLKGGPDKFETWTLDAKMFNVYLKGMTNPVQMVKENDTWKFDFKADAALKLCVDRLNEEYKDYENAYKVLSQEVKNDPATKENVRNRLKTLMEEAAK